MASCFQASGATYEKSARVQQEISSQLMGFLGRYDKVNYSSVLEIGCCTGVLTELLCSSAQVDTLYINDIVEEFCEKTAARVEDRVGCSQIIAGDIEESALPEKLDLVLSSSTFQWITDLPLLLERLQQSLRPGGYLAFSLFGPGTMREIAELTGNCLVYRECADLLRMVGREFAVVFSHTEERCIYFSSVRGVLRHIRETGVGAVGRQKWTRAKLKKFEQQYLKHYSSEKGIPVSYVSTSVIARKNTEIK